ncbi:MAG: nuclease-related domain-containing protein [Mizugakiibacter sp.]|uniref:nuclease-related domain-containing protein n=1 Tax=Mizugakiibacter sp. TaxID=1972610 RepID=UPI0031BDDE6E|nr:NERD domain-containing protein [Xanthomonadaceae bacterium]
MLLSELLVLAAIAVGLLPIGILALWVWWHRRTDRRRSPLTTELHNLPGEQARREAERLAESAGDRLMIAVLVGPLALAAWALQKIDKHLLRFGPAEIALLIIVVAVACWAIWSAGKRLRDRWNYLDGIAAERATAQALMPLISKGCAIYHDIPTGMFNLDHVVVGPDGVFMIEAKSRRKPAARGKASAEVRFDGKTLEFPGWRETKMLDQTRAQTRWLNDYLYRKTGERVSVKPVLALPGWFVSNSVLSPDMHVINPKMCNFMADSKGKPLSEPQRRRIMAAIEECYGGSGS